MTVIVGLEKNKEWYHYILAWIAFPKQKYFEQNITTYYVRASERFTH